MAEALFITRQDLVRFTAVNGNVDTDKFIQFIKIAQDIHIQRILGSKLYHVVQSKISGGTLTGDYLDLVNNYVKKMLIHWSMVEYLPFAAYQINNKGIFTSELFFSVSPKLFTVSGESRGRSIKPDVVKQKLRDSNIEEILS